MTPLPSWVPGDETKPAPMPLLLVQAFVNTWEGDSGADLLSDPKTAAVWLHEAGLWEGDAPPSWDEVRLARDVRESIRALLTSNGGGPRPDRRALQALEVLAASGRVQVGVEPDGGIRLAPDPGEGRHGQLLRLLLIMRDAQKDGTWPRLKTCQNDACRWAFYDRSHTHQGRWCDMAVCGNRIKNRNLRQRRR